MSLHRNGTDSQGGGAGAPAESLAEQATAWFVRLSSDRVTDEDRNAFRAWLDRDPAHRRAFAEAEALWGELGRIPDPRRNRRPRLAGARPAVCRGLESLGLPALGAVAAAVLLVLFLGYRAAVDLPGVGPDYETDTGEVLAIVLSDGTRVELNTDTALDILYRQDRRQVRLRHGEAFFAVSPDPDRPFEVLAGGGLARALGTAFNLRTDSSTTSVAVAEGRVRVVPEAGSEGAGLDLRAGEAVRYDDGRMTGRYRVAVEDLTAWRTGRLVFADLPLRQVVAELDRYRPGVIVILGSAVAEERFTGAFALRDTDRALAAMEAALPVEVLVVGPWLTLIRPD